MKLITNPYSLKPTKGFTIVELIVTMGLFSILTVIIMTMFSSIFDLKLDSESVSAVEQDGKFIITRLLYDIPSAQSVATPASLGQQTTSLQMVINSVTNTYALSGGNLQLTNSNGTNNLNSVNTTVTGFQVTRLGNLNGKHALKIVLTITSKIQHESGTDTKTYQTTIGLR